MSCRPAKHPFFSRIHSTPCIHQTKIVYAVCNEGKNAMPVMPIPDLQRRKRETIIKSKKKNQRKAWSRTRSQMHQVQTNKKIHLFRDVNFSFGFVAMDDEWLFIVHRASFKSEMVALKQADAMVKIRAVPALSSVQVMKILWNMLRRHIRWNPRLRCKGNQIRGRPAQIHCASSFEKLGTRVVA